MVDVEELQDLLDDAEAFEETFSARYRNAPPVVGQTRSGRHVRRVRERPAPYRPRPRRQPVVQPAPAQPAPAQPAPAQAPQPQPHVLVPSYHLGQQSAGWTLQAGNCLARGDIVGAGYALQKSAGYSLAEGNADRREQTQQAEENEKARNFMQSIYAIWNSIASRR